MLVVGYSNFLLRTSTFDFIFIFNAVYSRFFLFRHDSYRIDFLRYRLLIYSYFIIDAIRFGQIVVVKNVFDRSGGNSFHIEKGNPIEIFGNGL